MEDILAQGMKGFRLLCWALSLPAEIALDSKQSHLHIAWAWATHPPPPPRHHPPAPHPPTPPAPPAGCFPGSWVSTPGPHAAGCPCFKWRVRTQPGAWLASLRAPGFSRLANLFLPKPTARLQRLCSLSLQLTHPWAEGRAPWVACEVGPETCPEP